MAANVIVDASFLVALLSRRDADHKWADRLALQYPPPWKTCDAVLSEALYLLNAAGGLSALVRRGALVSDFDFHETSDATLALMERYSNVPMSFADACLVRMTDILPDPVLLTADGDFRLYRRDRRRVVPCVLPR